MIAKIESELACTADDLWVRISRQASLQYIAAPLLKFLPLDGTELSESWQAGEVYELKLYAFGVVPLGAHHIHMEVVDRDNHLIITRESGHLAKVWNHRIQFQEVGQSRLRYVDVVEIQAGWLTLPIWCFAQGFYRHRQRRWRKLLKEAVRF